jgi:glycosyltransferase involved in cell wall biosynthesis
VDSELPRISLVIPAWNEEKYIRPTLESVTRAKSKYAAQARRAVEVIVVDNDSSDRTAEIAAEFGCRVVPFGVHQISAVRNAGAREATGEFIAFVDADRSVVPEDLFFEIDRNLSDRTVYGGGSAFTPERWSVLTATAVCLVRVFCWLSGLGCVLFYLRRSDFEGLGGWNEAMYAAEDIDLAKRMKTAARSSGRRLRHLRGRVCVCTRKLELVSVGRTLRMSWRALRRWDFTDPSLYHDYFYDVERLR